MINFDICLTWFSSIQSLSHVQLFVTPWTAALQASLSFIISQSLLKPLSCPLSWWCHPTISSSVIPFSSHLQSFPALGCFQMSQFFTSGGQSIGVSASTSVLPMNILDWFPLGWTDWIALLSKGPSRVFSSIRFESISSLALSLLYGPALTSIHDSWKTIALIRQTFVGKVMSQLFNTLSRLVIAFLSMTKRFLISWVQSPSAVTLEPKKIVSHHFHCFPIYLPLSDGTLKLEQCHVSQAQGTWLS